MWSELVVDGNEQTGRRTKEARSGGDTQNRLDEVARRGRGLVRDLREQRLALPDAVARVVGIVEVAEGGEPLQALPIQAGGLYDRRAGIERDVRVLTRRLEQVAQMGRELLGRSRSQPTFPLDQLLREHREDRRLRGARVAPEVE